MAEPIEGDRCPNCGLPITADGPCGRCGMEVTIYRGPSVTEPPKEPDPLPPRSWPLVTTNILVAALGLFWLVLAGVLLVAALGGGWGPGPMIVFMLGFLCLVVAAYHFYVAVAIFHHSSHLQGPLVLASVIGILWGVLAALILDWWPPLVACPFHLVMAVSAVFGGNYLEPRRVSDR